jgi:hypothetical protein
MPSYAVREHGLDRKTLHRDVPEVTRRTKPLPTPRSKKKKILKATGRRHIYYSMTYKQSSSYNRVRRTVLVRFDDVVAYGALRKSQTSAFLVIT